MGYLNSQEIVKPGISVINCGSLQCAYEMWAMIIVYLSIDYEMFESVYMEMSSGVCGLRSVAVFQHS